MSTDEKSVQSQKTSEVVLNRVSTIAKSCVTSELLTIEKSFSAICHSVSCGDCVLLIDGACIYSPVLDEIANRKAQNIAGQLAEDYTLDTLLDALYIKMKGE